MVAARGDLPLPFRCFRLTLHPPNCAVFGLSAPKRENHHEARLTSSRYIYQMALHLHMMESCLFHLKKNYRHSLSVQDGQAFPVSNEQEQ